MSKEEEEEEEGRGRRSKSSEEEIQTLSEERTDLELATNDLGAWCGVCMIRSVSSMTLVYLWNTGEDQERMLTDEVTNKTIDHENNSTGPIYP